MHIDRSLWILLSLFLFAMSACDGGAPSKYSKEALEDLAAIEFGSGDFDPLDDRAMTRARREYWIAKVEFADWVRTNDEDGSIWGDACETRCWADWWMCVDSCTDHDGIHPLSLDLNGGFGHSNDQCWEYCDFKHDRCVRRCERARERTDELPD